MPYYTTEYCIKGKKGKYTTQKITDMHKRIHQASEQAITMHYDDYMPFGTLVAVTNKEKPEYNQPFDKE